MRYDYITEAGKTVTQNTRNARLIAAAPEMLEALIKLVACCEKLPAFTNTGNLLSIDRLNKARAAIAKAEGRSND